VKCFRSLKALVTRRYMVVTGDRETKIRKTDKEWREGRELNGLTEGKKRRWGFGVESWPASDEG